MFQFYGQDSEPEGSYGDAPFVSIPDIASITSKTGATIKTMHTITEDANATVGLKWQGCKFVL